MCVCIYIYLHICTHVYHPRSQPIPTSQEIPWQLLILLSPPAMKLHEHIASCVELSKNKFSADAGDEEGAMGLFFFFREIYGKKHGKMLV